MENLLEEEADQGGKKKDRKRKKRGKTCIHLAV
jgi:hypothetical protein